ncbi:MAG: RHS repeat-associated core domain-containing protein [Methylophilus sp.]|nr:RHS repeat-associated core domain-containing protein [Methylophilus sp.]
MRLSEHLPKHFSLLFGLAFIGTLHLSPIVISPANADTPSATLDYDANQNIITRTTPLGTTTYTYDDLNRLNSESGPAKTQSFNYDANANRTSSTSPLDGSKTYTYTPNTDRLATINGQSISMDAMGNTLTARGYTYTWNQAGQLKEVKLGTGGSAVLLATYYYDYKNLRSRKVTTAAAPQGASTVLYSYDEANHLQTEIRAAGGIATPLYSYVWRDDIPVAVIIHPAAQIAANPTFATNPPANFNPNADQVIYLEVDHLNTPRIGRDQSGKKVWSWESDAFGSTLANEDPDNDGHKVIINLRFPGQQFDQESGLHYNHHRYYDPNLAGGRYLNSDPSGLAGGLNNFGYANQSPLKYIDRNGKNPLVIGGVAALGLGIGIGIGAIPNPLKPPVANNGNGNDWPFDHPRPQTPESYPVVEVPTAPFPDPRDCQGRYADDLERCQLKTETHCYAGIDFDRLACRYAAYKRFKACMQVNSPFGMDPDGK